MVIIMYTIGYAPNYDKALADCGPVIKIGPRPDKYFDKWDGEYPGGWVFTTKEEALKLASEYNNYAVYELIGNPKTARRYDGHLHLDEDTEILRRVSRITI